MEVITYYRLHIDDHQYSSMETLFQYIYDNYDDYFVAVRLENGEFIAFYIHHTGKCNDYYIKKDGIYTYIYGDNTETKIKEFCQEKTEYFKYLIENRFVSEAKNRLLNALQYEILKYSLRQNSTKSARN